MGLPKRNFIAKKLNTHQYDLYKNANIWYKLKVGTPNTTQYAKYQANIFTPYVNKIEITSTNLKFL